MLFTIYTFIKIFSCNIFVFFGLIEPFCSFLWVVFYQKTIPHYFFISLTIVGCGLYLYYQEELRISSPTITKKE